MVEVRKRVGRARERLGRTRLRLFPNTWPPTLDPDPPPPWPDDHVIGPPDYIGIGAPRAGSTWVHKLLASHPDVRRQPWGKELHFFDRYYDLPFTDADVRRYHSYFPRPAGTVTGDFTPGYLYQPWSRPLIQRAAPNALLLVVLRDPVEQWRSSVNYSAHHGAPVNGIMVSRHMGEAMFATHLRLWADAPPERLRVIQSEYAFAHPEEVVRGLWKDLGLDTTPEVRLHRNRNEARQMPIRPTDEALRCLIRYLEPDVMELVKHHPHIDLSLWPNFAHLARPAERS